MHRVPKKNIDNCQIFSRWNSEKSRDMRSLKAMKAFTGKDFDRLFFLGSMCAR